MLQRQMFGPPSPTGAGADFDNFLLQFGALEQAAIRDGYGFTDRITAFRKLYYDSPSAAKTYAGAVVGGGAFNILIPGAAATKPPPSWSTPRLDGAADYLRKHQILSIGGQSVDIGHMLAGADAAKHPTSVSLAAGLVKLRSNVEATTFVGDLGSVVTEYIHGSKASFRDTAMVRSPVLDSYYDGSNAMASAEDMAGNADAYSLTFDSAKTLTENLRDYYAATSGGAKKRFTGFAAAIGLGTLSPSGFSGNTTAWRDAMREEVFNSALAYAAGKGWKGDARPRVQRSRPRRVHADLLGAVLEHLGLGGRHLRRSDAAECGQGVSLHSLGALGESNESPSRSEIEAYAGIRLPAGATRRSRAARSGDDEADDVRPALARPRGAGHISPRFAV